MNLRNVIAIAICLAATTTFFSCEKESSDKQIITFGFTSPQAEGVINEAAKTIVVEVPLGTDISALAPVITVSNKATVSPASGEVRSFINPVTYTVTAEDGSTANYKVKVSVTADHFTANEKQKMNVIKTKYANIQTNFPGGYFITVPTITPSYTLGEVKNEVLQAGLNAINLARYIAGIPDDVELNADYTDLCQHGAVLLSATDILSHTPEKPADMDPSFYNKGYQATTSSNLSTNASPTESAFLYLYDSAPSNIATLGHRRWILNPPMKKTGFGIGATMYGVMYAFDESRGKTDYDYVAWPSQGVFPVNLFNENQAWSISVNTEKYGIPDINKVEVTLKHLNSGEVWTFSNSTPSSTSMQSAYFNIDKGMYGISNCIIFRPALGIFFNYRNDDVFQVTVSGLNQTISYTVKMFSL